MSLSKFNVWREGAGNQPIEGDGNQPIKGDDLDINKLTEKLIKLIDIKVGSSGKIGSSPSQISDAITSVIHSLLQNTKYANGLSTGMATNIVRGIKK